MTYIFIIPFPLINETKVSKISSHTSFLESVHLHSNFRSFLFPFPPIARGGTTSPNNSPTDFAMNFHVCTNPREPE